MRSAPQRNQTGCFVQPAAAKRLQIERNELESGSFERGDGAVSLAQKRLELALADLDPGDLAVIPDAEFPQAQRAQGHLARGELLEAFGGDLGAVRDARREARLLRLVPGGQAALLR